MLHASNLSRNVTKSIGRSTFLSPNATIAVAKWGVIREFFLFFNATFVALQVARNIALCNMALRKNLPLNLKELCHEIQQN